MNIALAPLKITVVPTPEPTVCSKYSDRSFEYLIRKVDIDKPRRLFCRSLRGSKTCCCLLRYLCIIVGLSSSLVSILVTGVVVGIPYHSARKYIDTECRTVKSVYISDNVRCFCGKRCNSSYPCILLRVEYNPYAIAEKVQLGQLHEDETKLQRQVCCMWQRQGEFGSKMVSWYRFLYIDTCGLIYH